MQDAHMAKVLENCREGWYPLHSEQSISPKLSKEDTLRYMKIALTHDHILKDEISGYHKKAYSASDLQEQEKYFVMALAIKQRANDALFIETGIERHDLERAIKFYYQNDPVFAQNHAQTYREVVLG